MQNNAPKISAKEVPGNLRPLMSHALWRLHESIDRNDSNQLFLLSNQEEICAIAKKLNIMVHTSRELAERIGAAIEKVDLNVTSMLEEEDLVKPKEGAKPVESQDSITAEHSENLTQKVTANGDPTRGKHVGQNGSAGSNDHDEYPTSSTSQADVILEPPTSEKPAATAAMDKIPPSEPSNNVTKVGLDPQELVKSILNPSLLQTQAPQATEENRTEDITSQRRNLQPAIEIMQASPDHTTREELAQPQPSAESQSHAAKQAPANAQENLDDSDEEVVVFVPNPKRMSAQKKANASSSRPSTAHGESPAPPMQDSPKAGPSKVHTVQNAAGHGSPNVKLVPHGHPRPLSSNFALVDAAQGSTNVKVVPHGHPRPLSSGPTVIDPDAFGRGFATNTGPGTLASIGTSRKPRQHSPRTSVQNPNPNANSASAQSSPHASPPRRKAGRSPRPSSGAIPQKMEDSPLTSVPVISHQAYTRAPLVPPHAQSMQKSRFGPIEPPPKSGNSLYPSTPTGGAGSTIDSNHRQAPVQRPRSAHGPGVGRTSNSPHHSSMGPNPPDIAASPARGRQQIQKSSKKSLFEPELDRTEAQPDVDSEPKRMNMPEVQYTLKSGTTREAARGKGKLWVG